MLGTQCGGFSSEDLGLSLRYIQLFQQNYYGNATDDLGRTGNAVWLGWNV